MKAYANSMASGLTTTIRLEAADAEALRKAQADGFETSELLSIGLRMVAARYYPKQRKPHLGLFGCVDAKLADES